MNPALIFGWLPVIGVAIGLTRARWARVPLIAAALLVALYVAYVAATGIYASTCWDCASRLSGSRGDAWQAGAFILGIMLALTLAGVWLGARLTLVLGRLFAAARDLREATRPDQPYPEQQAPVHSPFPLGKGARGLGKTPAGEKGKHANG